MRGETRNQRLAEFACVKPEVPVLGLPEGNWLRVAGAKSVLHGPHTSWWFQSGHQPRPLSAGALDIV